MTRIRTALHSTMQSKSVVVVLLPFFAALALAEDHDDPAMLQTGAEQKAKEYSKGGVCVPTLLVY